MVRLPAAIEPLAVLERLTEREAIQAKLVLNLSPIDRCLPANGFVGNSKSDAVVGHLALPLPMEGYLAQSVPSNLLGSEAKTSSTTLEAIRRCGRRSGLTAIFFR